MENRFNLVDEDWIPVADVGRVSLRRIFEDPSLKMLGGSILQKISVTKLLLAIAQRVWTPEDDEGWKEGSPDALARRCLEYLGENRDLFWLYGDRPFLQMPEVKKAEEKTPGALNPEIATGNTTVHFQTQIERKLEDPDLALTVLQAAPFALSGKKTDNKVVLTAGYQGKTKDNGKQTSGKSGPSLGHGGLLHQFWTGGNLWETLYFNIFTTKDVESMGFFPEGLGVPPWEEMPAGEDDERARRLKNSYMGRLIPLSRFILLADGMIHVTEGIQHPTYKEGIWDPSCAVDTRKKTYRSLWTKPEQRPWRNLTSLLSFINKEKVYDCFQIILPYQRIREKVDVFGLWAGGLSVSSNAGEQYCSGTDDAVESLVILDGDSVGKRNWFKNLEAEMAGMEKLSSNLWGSIKGYSGSQSITPQQVKNTTAKAQSEFWQLCEGNFQELVNSCEDTEALIGFRKIFAGYVLQLYDKYCPNETARQMTAWAKNRPRVGKYLRELEKEAQGAE